MMDEFEIDKLMQPLINRQEQINMTILTKIAERVKAINTILPSDVYKLEQLLKTGEDVREINRKIAELTRLQEKEIKKIIKTVAKDAYKDAKPYYDYRKKSFIPYEENVPLRNAVQSIMRVTLADYTNLSNSTAFMWREPTNPLIVRPTTVSQTYQNVIDLGIQKVITGAGDYNSAIQDALKQLVNSGGLKMCDNTQKVEYTSINGKKHYARADTVVRRNILDGIRDVLQTVQDITGKQFGADGVEISVHQYSAPDHEPIQGHQFTNAEYDNIQTGQDFKDVNGIEFHKIDRPIGLWNCRHFAWKIIVGQATPNYTLKQLEEIKQKNADGITVKDRNGNEVRKSMYWCTQRQRQYELSIRKAKEGKKVSEIACDEKLQKEWQAKIVKLQNEYKVFCKESGLKTRFDKTKIYTDT